MGRASRDKGKRGERELAGILRDYGYDCRRGQQYCGASGAADVVGLPGLHIECKRVERLQLSDAVAQAVRDSGIEAADPDRERLLPAVCHRKDREGWLVTMRLDEFMEIYREWQASMDLREKK